MAERKVLCEEFRNDVDLCIEEVQMGGTVKGEQYSYLGKKAHCVDCSEEIYLAEVHDYNQKGLYDAYRKKNGTVSLGTILAIPEQYAIGKRPLSLLLG